MFVALTRAVPPTIVNCQLTHLDRVAIDVEVAARQHAAYEETLRGLGVRVERVEPATELPDSVFIEDAAVVLDEVAVITRPGALSRRGEVDAVSRALAIHRTLRFIEAPGTMDGGDVLTVGRRVFVGLSHRTNLIAAEQLREIVEPLGYRLGMVGVRECLHLKSAATALSDDQIVINPRLIDSALFEGLECLEIAPGEPEAANVVRVGAAILCPESAPGTAALLASRGFDVRRVPSSELAKAEGALTCCSLIFRA
jgi:dimethylargininase